MGEDVCDQGGIDYPFLLLKTQLLLPTDQLQKGRQHALPIGLVARVTVSEADPACKTLNLRL